MLYTKEINGQQVFSTCDTIQMPDGSWVSNPSDGQIEAAGWSVYEPPVVPPTPQTEPGMYDVMEAVKKMLSSSVEDLSDEDALAVAALYPTWEKAVEEGKPVEIGKRLWYDERLWKVLQSHTPSSAWTPDTAVSLYVQVTIEEIPEWRQPTGAQDAYMMGDKVRYQGEVYESTVDNNTWAPDVYGWIQID